MMNILNTKDLNDRQLLQLMEVSLALHADETVVLSKRDLERIIALAKYSTFPSDKKSKYANPAA